MKRTIGRALCKVGIHSMEFEHYCRYTDDGETCREYFARRVCRRCRFVEFKIHRNWCFEHWCWDDEKWCSCTTFTTEEEKIAAIPDYAKHAMRGGRKP